MFIQVNDIKKSYAAGENTNQVLAGVSMTLEQEQIGVILGPSGSGKSTLMNLIGGVDRADSGTIMVDATVLTSCNDRQLTDYRRDMIGFIFQFYNLIPHLTVLENIEVIANISKSPLPVRNVLQAVGLDNRQKSFPNELSGGEQQRVAIARALIKNPKLLLCDEPTGALDYETSRDVLALLQKINLKFGTTILMITHNQVIGDMANVVYKLRSGRITDIIHNKKPAEAERIEW